MGTPLRSGRRQVCFPPQVGWQELLPQLWGIWGISFTSPVGKLYHRVLLNWVRVEVDTLLCYNQGRFTVQQVLSLHRILEQCKMRQNSNCVALCRLLQGQGPGWSWYYLATAFEKTVKAIMSMHLCTSDSVITPVRQIDLFLISMLECCRDAHCPHSCSLWRSTTSWD